MSRRICVFGAVIALSFVFPEPDSASARPLYKKVWNEMYRKRLPERVKVGCSLCHPSKSKKERSGYAKAFENELGDRNVRDRERIREALKKVEDLMPVPLKPEKR